MHFISGICIYRTTLLLGGNDDATTSPPPHDPRLQKAGTLGCEKSIGPYYERLLESTNLLI